MSDPFLDFFKQLPLLDKPQYIRDAEEKRRAERRAERQAEADAKIPVISERADALMEDTFEALGEALPEGRGIRLTAMLKLRQFFQNRGFANDLKLILPQQILKIDHEPLKLESIAGLLSKPTMPFHIRGLIAVMAMENPRDIRKATYMACCIGDDNLRMGVIELIHLMSDEMRDACFPAYRAFEKLDYTRLDEVLLSFMTNDADKAEMLSFMLSRNVDASKQRNQAHKKALKAASKLDDAVLQRELLETGFNAENLEIRQHVFDELLTTLKNKYDQQQFILEKVKKTFHQTEFFHIVDNLPPLFETDKEKAVFLKALLSGNVVKNTYNKPDTNEHKQRVMANIRPLVQQMFSAIGNEATQQELVIWAEENTAPAVVALLSQSILPF